MMMALNAGGCYTRLPYESLNAELQFSTAEFTVLQNVVTLAVPANATQVWRFECFVVLCNYFVPSLIVLMCPPSMTLSPPQSPTRYSQTKNVSTRVGSTVLYTQMSTLDMGADFIVSGAFAIASPV